MNASEYIPFFLQHSQKSSNMWAAQMAVAVGILGLIGSKPDIVDSIAEKVFFSIGITILSAYFFESMRIIHKRKINSWNVVTNIHKSEIEDNQNNELRNSISDYINSLEPIRWHKKALGILAIYLFLLCFIWVYGSVITFQCT